MASAKRPRHHRGQLCLLLNPLQRRLYGFGGKGSKALTIMRRLQRALCTGLTSPACTSRRRVGRYRTQSGRLFPGEVAHTQPARCVQLMSRERMLHEKLILNCAAAGQLNEPSCPPPCQILPRQNITRLSSEHRGRLPPPMSPYQCCTCTITPIISRMFHAHNIAPPGPFFNTHRKIMHNKEECTCCPDRLLDLALDHRIPPAEDLHNQRVAVTSASIVSSAVTHGQYLRHTSSFLCMQSLCFDRRWQATVCGGSRLISAAMRL